MEKAWSLLSTDIPAMMEAIAAIFSELNIGLLIFHLEDPEEARSLKLLYVNKIASEYTGADLETRVGKHIVEAFPGLADTDLPEGYAAVALTNRSRNFGTFEYGGDDMVGPGFYKVKAFPMPNHCVGIIFENITVRKQLEELVKRQQGKAKP